MLTTTYKGQTLNYELFYEVCDFVEEVDGLDWMDDENKIVRIAQRLDGAAIKAARQGAPGNTWGQV